MGSHIERHWTHCFVVLLLSLHGCSDESATVDSSAEADIEVIPDATGSVSDSQSLPTDVDAQEMDSKQMPSDVDFPEVSILDADMAVDAEDNDSFSDLTDTSDSADTIQGPSMGPPVEVYPIVDQSLGDISAALDDAGRLHVLWAARETLDGPQELRLSRSDLTVTAFPDQIKIKHFGNDGPVDPDLKVDGKHFMMTWTEKEADSGLDSIRFRRATLGELADPAIEAKETVVTKTGGLESLWRPYIVRATVKTMFVIWQRGDTVNLARSSDSGESFFAPVKINESGEAAQVSDAAYVPPGRLVVAYQKGTSQTLSTIAVKVSDDLGSTFTAPVDVSNMFTDGHNLEPTITLATSGDTFLAWSRCGPDKCADGSKPEVWMASTQNGLEWGNHNKLPMVSTKPKIRSGKGSTLYLSGLDNKDLNSEKPGAPLFLTSPDLGKSWWDPSQIPSAKENVIMTYDLVANRKKGLLHVVWWAYIKTEAVNMGLRAATIGK